MATAFFRTLILYLLLIAGLRISGKRQIGELEPIELVLTLLISDLASVPMLEQLRAQGVTDLNDVKYAVMETSGKLSVLLRSDCQPLTPRQLALTVEDDTFLPTVIINDGRVLADNLRQCGRDERWLEKELHRQGVKRSEDVFLLTVDQQGTVVCLRKEGAR